MRGRYEGIVLRSIILLALSLIGVEEGGRSFAQETLTILHSSEHHGTIQPIEERGQPKVGGMAGRATLIDAIRRDNAAVLLVDSGDILIGTALSSFFRGEPDIKAMNLMGYRAMAAGNHDFDFGLDHLRRLQELATFPILCSNLKGRAVDLPCRPSAVIRAGALSIGVISVLGRSNFPDTFNREVARLLELRDPVESSRSLARELKTSQSVDLVIAVTHQTTEEDLALLAEAPELDAVIGGHTEGFDGFRTTSHDQPVAELDHPGPVFVKTHRQGRTLGRLELQVTKKPGGNDAPTTTTVVRAKATNLPVTEQVAQHPAVQGLIDEYARKLESQASIVIGRSLVTLDGENTHIRAQETSLGNLLADLVRDEFGTEIALVNSGQIRDSIPAGSVDIKRVLRVLPFNSPSVTFSVTGGQLLQALENSVSRLPQTAGRFLQVSGLTVIYDLSAAPQTRVRQVTIGERLLELTRRYSVATDAFLADGGDGFTMFATATDRVERQTPLRDLLLQALQVRPLKASVEGRIRFVEAAVP
ncbi:MAG: bifunctional metallophosphatase/5'-nucleotidase [Nitrospiraceae bacterium]